MLQQAATDKENLVGRAHRSGKDSLLTKTSQRFVIIIGLSVPIVLKYF